MDEDGILHGISQCLNRLQTHSTTYSQHCPDDTVLHQQLKMCQDTWKTLQDKIQDTEEQLQQIPQKWKSYSEK